MYLYHYLPKTHRKNTHTHTHYINLSIDSHLHSPTHTYLNTEAIAATILKALKGSPSKCHIIGRWAAPWDAPWTSMALQIELGPLQRRRRWAAEVLSFCTGNICVHIKLASLRHIFGTSCLRRGIWPSKFPRLTPENPAKKTGTSGLRQIQREHNPLARPWKSHRVTRVSPGVLVFLGGARCWCQMRLVEEAGWFNLVKPLQLCCFSHDFLGTCSPLPGLLQPA